MNAIIPAGNADFTELLAGRAPRPWRLVNDSVISPPEVLQMLSDLADSIRPAFDPAAWLIVQDDEVVGLLSLVRPFDAGEICIGYGVAPTRRGRGATTAALAGLLEWARSDIRLGRVIAETNHDNLASQRVLEHNGFARIGERVDAEDGALIVWQALVA
jgi:RimJ/RimL family protein N-acetyltransferase